MYHKTKSYRIFTVFNYIFMIAISALCVIPLIHVLAVSFSGKSAANANLVGLWPVDFTLDAYTKTVANENFTRSIWVTLQRTVLGTAFSMGVVILAGYALSKENARFRRRNLYIWLLVFTMLFSGGLVPMYILIQKLNLMNSIWVLILPGAVSVWNIILLLNFFRAVPKEMEEAAFIDGAGHFRTLFSVYLPVSMPAIATLSLFTIVGHWNSWFDGLLYMTDHRNYPLATFLQSVIVQQDFSKVTVRPEDLENISQRTVKAAQIFIGMAPILIVYPFLQRFFVKGIVLGAVKE
ncbi:MULTISPECIES: carbohydrate ABC transporter permease [unclassified Paenibacillus]|uniref:carbohydrate ABC transporter permease n=1 Tax=unclassified Paenibacillus TaxID=185978 RepID=UPI0024073A78|nr:MULTISPECIES: carbohydrate ABC transporter permease [unclassified Paenibacillus]MDF9843667.1 putative aldouronate transport system permease protein [Paenibacillus sp. PastF-2]MDF9850255.1 putative aldouronate transport system permease protein [Paenibacillus sp. PastM-2]MDF9856805.1 putative aldouronate transport system permease protein [Paenibacillus sp. PastF-1]MDH6482102.1 putative aldouronate transport system permease protein [Paenibacillus sp. PastH-2]MDH6509524.1 putative aldouronate t